MRIAAGVLLIIAAVLNLLASFAYLGGGAATTGLSDVSEQAIEASLMEAESEMTAEEREAASEIAGNIKGAGGMWMAMGVFLLVSVGILIAGAVFLFQSKQPKFAMASGIVALVAEGLGIALTAFGVMNLVGLVAGVLTIFAARSYMSPAAAPDPGAA